MKKLRSILWSMLALAGLGTLAAGATEYKQVGTPNLTASYGNTTSNFPVYTMSKYGQGINIYRKEAIGLNSGVVIKEISFTGYASEKNYEGATIQVYIGNTTETSYQAFVVDGEPEGSAATTKFDTTKATLFYDGPFSQEAIGAKGDPAQVFKISSETGVTYEGENLVVYMFLSVPKTSPYITTYLATASGNTYKNTGAYRDSGYNKEGYSVFTKRWSTPNSSDQVPVMTIGYEGEAQTVSAHLTGRILSGLNNTGINGATVELLDGETVVETVTTASSGSYTIDVAEVDMTANYIVRASMAGYETKTQSVDLKAGGNIADINLTLPKLPVPATLSGYVIDSETSQPMAGIGISFNNQETTSADNGAYSFYIENVDVLPPDGLTLAASAPGYYNFSTSLRITADMEFNIEMQPLAPLPGEGAQVGMYTLSSYDYMAPFNTLWGKSITEVIYPQSLLGNLVEGQKYSSVSFFGYIPSSTTPPVPDEGDDDYNYGYDDYGMPRRAGEAETAYEYTISLYLLNTTENGYTASSEGQDLTGLSKLYEGTVTMTEGGSAAEPKLLFSVDLDNPFEYEGGNMKMIVTCETRVSKLVYFAQDPAATSNVLTMYGSTLEGQSWRLNTTGVPVMRFGDYVASATISGIVTDMETSAPIEGAEVTLSYDTSVYTAVTDAEGNYSISVRDVVLDEDYALTVSMDGYEEANEPVVFTADNMDVTMNIQLERTPGVGVAAIDAESGRGVVYNALGIRVADSLKGLPKGLYIMDGKIVLVK